MTGAWRVAVLVGGLQKGSYSHLVALALADMAPPGLELAITEIRKLRLYDEDAEVKNVPFAWARFREEVKNADAVLFVTPEYNRSVPGALKNAIDVGSQPGGKSVWKRKPTAVISVSPDSTGGFGANHHLRQSLVFLDMPVLQQPEAYIGDADTLFDDGGVLVDESTIAYFHTFLAAFQALVERELGPPVSVPARCPMLV